VWFSHNPAFSAEYLCIGSRVVDIGAALHRWQTISMAWRWVGCATRDTRESPELFFVA